VGKFGSWCWIALGLICSTVFARIDENANGVSDVWETAHGAAGDLDLDSDGDGFTDRQEAAAGTDPHDGSSFPKMVRVAREGEGKVSARWPTVAGIRYRVMVSENFSDWFPIGEPVIGTGGEHEETFDKAEDFTGGGVRRWRWGEMTSGNIATIKGYVANVSPAPTVDDSLEVLELPRSNPEENYFGQWIRGWIVPPETGAYTFWIASDDSSELWISDDADPAGKTLAASVSDYTGFRQWTKHASQKSTPRVLEKGRSYYFEIYHREWTSGDHVSVAWTKPGMAEDEREIIGGRHLSSSGRSLGEIAGDGGRLFFKLVADHVDSDGDGVSDYEEHLLGLDRNNATSTPRVEDLQAARTTLASPSTVTLGVSAPRAYELEGMPARFVVSRAGGIGPVEVGYTVAGGAVSGGDYVALPGTVRIPAGARAVEIEVMPLADGLLEPAETVTLTLQSGAGYLLGSPAETSVTIDDAADVIYLAQIRPAGDVLSKGTGTAVVRRTGNSLGGRVRLAFSGLSGEQTSAVLFVSDDGSGGSVVYTFPLAQVPGLDWDFAAAGGLEREEILDALDSGRLWVRISSAVYPDGELLGRLVATPGWEAMPDPPAPLAAPVEADSTGEAARFLTQATFGPTEAALVELEQMTYEQWIDAQLALPSSFHLPYVEHRRAELLARNPDNDGWQGPRQEAWWQHALTAPDQLRQRMAFALSQILVISQFGALDSYHEGTTLYYDMLVEHAFGNYRELLEDVTLSPMMGTYLSMMRNKKPDPVTGHEPDENYAREVMQLFSVGLSRMHTDGSLALDGKGMPVPTYTQDDTVGLAHVFTGWGPHYDSVDPPRWSNGDVADRAGWFQWGYDQMREMTFYPEFHDTKDRTILGGVVIPAGTDGRARLEQALDALFNHPNVGPFLARQLIQRFVTSNPSPGYIHRVAVVFNDNGQGVRGNLGAVIKAVLLDPEARHPAYRAGTGYGKPAEPVLRMSRMYRVLPTPPPLASLGDSRYFFNLQWELPEQAPLMSSSVFNFFQPGYSNPGRVARAGLLSPEFQIFAETTAIRQANSHFSSLMWSRGTSEPDPGDSEGGNAEVTIDYAPLIAILNTLDLTPVQAQGLLLDHLEDRFLFGAMSDALRAEILSAYAMLPGWFGYTTDRQQARVQMAVYLIVNSPEFFVQR
jgi:uncharacterized protein (DUF1800 family)